MTRKNNLVESTIFSPISEFFEKERKKKKENRNLTPIEESYYKKFLLFVIYFLIAQVCF